jgi:hypothetical protein
MHISIFCAPAAESPAGAGACADAAPGSASVTAAASKNSLVIDRLSSDCRKRRKYLGGGRLEARVFYGLAAMPVKQYDDRGQDG